MDVASIRTQVQNRISDDLSRAVIRHVTASARLVQLDSTRHKLLLAPGHVRPAVAPDAKRDDRRVLQKKEKVRNATGASLLNKRFLEFERVAVGNYSEAAYFEAAYLRWRFRRASVSSC
jgi:hypothetical protein